MKTQLLSAYLRLPEHPAKQRIAGWLGRNIFPEHGIVTSVAGGVRLYLHPRDWIEYRLLQGIPYEPFTLEFLRRNLRPADNVLLAGVNNGLHVIVAALAVGPTGCVIGVEPQAEAFVRARRNIELNGVAGTVRLVAAALGNGARLTPMAWSQTENAGAASLLDSGPGFFVPLLELSTVLTEVCRAPLRLMLLDVQGYEVPVLQGLNGDHLPDLLVVEDSPDWYEKARSSRQTLYGQLTRMGYALHDLFGKVVSADGPTPIEANVVGVRSGVAARWVER